MALQDDDVIELIDGATVTVRASNYDDAYWLIVMAHHGSTARVTLGINETRKVVALLTKWADRKQQQMDARRAEVAE